MQKIALVPLSKGTLINSSPLVQTIPLFRDKNGEYLFADTISVIGDFGLAVQAIDKREAQSLNINFIKLNCISITSLVLNLTTIEYLTAKLTMLGRLFNLN